MVYLLSTNSNVLERLRQEVLSTVGISKPTFDDIREMKYLRAVLNGSLVWAGRLSMRVNPAVFFRDAAPVSGCVSLPVEFVTLLHRLNIALVVLLAVLSIFGISNSSLSVAMSDPSSDASQSVHETTWPSQNPTDKPLYIPANTRYE